jgi:hypothetical protein
MAEPPYQQIAVTDFLDASPEPAGGGAGRPACWRLRFKLNHFPSSDWIKVFTRLARPNFFGKSINNPTCLEYEFDANSSDAVVVWCLKSKVPSVLKKIREVTKKANIAYAEYLKDEAALKVEVEKQVAEWKKLWNSIIEK